MSELALMPQLLKHCCACADNVDLGTACGKLHRVSVLAITDPGECTAPAVQTGQAGIAHLVPLDGEGSACVLSGRPMILLPVARCFLS